MSNRQIIREYWSQIEDGSTAERICASIADDRYEEVSGTFSGYVENTPGVTMPLSPATEAEEDAYNDVWQEAMAGVGDAFVLYLAKGCDVAWLIEQLTKYQKELQDEGSRVGG